MRYLRDTTFLAWAAIVMLLGSILVFAHAAGSQASPAPLPGQDVAVVKGATRSEAKETVERLRGLAPYGIAAGTNATALTTWAEQMQATAEEGLALRAAEGAGTGDKLHDGFSLIILRAGELQANADDAVAANSLRTSVLLAVDRVSNIVAGVPVPEGVENLTGGAVGPTTPTVPQLPDAGPTPALPTPLPGEQHRHPRPVLSPSPPSLGDLR